MKRHLLIIAVFLLLGAVANVAVAWGCAAWSPAVASGPPGGDPFPSLGPGASWPRSVPGDWPLPSYGSWGNGLFMSTGTFGGGIPKDQAVSEGRPTNYGLSLFRYGVPFRALECEVLMRISDPYARTDTLVAGVRAHQIASSRSFGLIPLRPIWPGFAINTIFYATLLWLLIPGPFALRRFLRVTRGLCPKCAYPMGESSVCTECGCGLPKRAGTT